MDQTILVVDDEADIVELVSYNLRGHGYNVVSAGTGEDAIRIACEKKPALIVLDLMLPGISGLDVCRKLKTNPSTEKIQIIMLTAKGEDSDIVTGIEAGADDYVTKPFSPRVLVARVRLALRKIAPDKEAEAQKVIANEITIDPERYEVLVGGLAVELTFSEFHILLTLAKRRGRVFSRYEIMDAVRGEDYIATERAIDVQITGLRKKLGRYGRYIETVRGVGYRFKD